LPIWNDLPADSELPYIVEFDNCGQPVQTAGLPSGSVFPVGTTTNTFVVYDAAGNSDECSFDVVVTDIEPPVIDCPDDYTVSTDPGECDAVVNVTFPTCSSYNVSQNGTFAPVDISGSGNYVGLGDDQLSGVLPIGFTFNFFGVNKTQFYISSNGFITFSPTGNGCCNGLPVPGADGIDDIIAAAWTDLVPGDIYYQTLGSAPNRVLVVSYTNMAHYGFGGSNTTQIKLFETSNRIEIHTTSFLTDGFHVQTQGIENASGTTGLTTPGRNSSNWSAQNDFVSFTPNATSDNCGCPVITQIGGPVSGSTFPYGPSVITLLATDVHGNTASCSYTVTVLDVEPPTITCPANPAYRTTDDDVCTYTAQGTEFDPLDTDDNCGVASVTNDYDNTSSLAGAVFDKGITIVTWTITDIHGNSSTCSFAIIVRDDQAPEYTYCPTNIVVGNDEGQCNAVVTWDPPTATDNCPAPCPANPNFIPLGSYHGHTYYLGFSDTWFNANAIAQSAGGTSCHYQ
jgi:hypothetical protein